MKRPAFTLFTTVSLVLLIAAATGAEPNPSLKGLKGAWVEIGPLDMPPAVASRIGLNRETIQTDVELKLRQAGMRVLTEAESDSAPGRPRLLVSVAASNDALAVGMSVTLFQDVRLVRDSTISVVESATWEREGIGSLPNAQKVRQGIKDLIDGFLNDWLSVNPGTR
jgi:hypothetical protein